MPKMHFLKKINMESQIFKALQPELAPSNESDYWNFETGFIARPDYLNNKMLQWQKPESSVIKSEIGKTPTFQQMPPSEYFGISDSSNTTPTNDNLSNIFKIKTAA